MKKKLLSFKRILKRKINELFFHKLYKRYRKYTMIKKMFYIDNLRLAEKLSYLDGDVVECGVWRGGMIAGIAEILKNDRRYYLFDSFEGLPKAKEIDGQAALNWQANKNSKGYYNNCKAEIEYAEKAMQIAGVTEYDCIKGWFNETLPINENRIDKITIMHIDCDWYDSVLICMEYLFPKVVSGGIILIDDYYVWEGTSKAIHCYLEKIKSPCKIYQLNDETAYLIKP